MNVTNFTSITMEQYNNFTAKYNCGIMKADFTNSFSTNFKLTFILSILLIIVYQWLGNYLRKKLLMKQITEEQFLNISYYSETILYLWYILIFFQIYVVFLSGMEW